MTLMCSVYDAEYGSIQRRAGCVQSQPKRHTERSRQHYLTVNPSTIPSAAFGTPVLLGERSNAT